MLEQNVLAPPFAPVRSWTRIPFPVWNIRWANTLPSTQHNNFGLPLFSRRWASKKALSVASAQCFLFHWIWRHPYRWDGAQEIIRYIPWSSARKHSILRSFYFSLLLSMIALNLSLLMLKTRNAGTQLVSFQRAWDFFKDFDEDFLSGCTDASSYTAAQPGVILAGASVQVTIPASVCSTVRTCLNRTFLIRLSFDSFLCSGLGVSTRRRSHLVVVPKARIAR